MAHSSRSWCQSAELRASREHSRPSTIPARPRDTSATRCWKPSRSAALAPEWPWSMSITVIWSASQPSAIALPRRSYWRIADSVLWMTCLRLDWRTYSRAVLDEVGGGHLGRRGVGEHGCSFRRGGWRDRGWAAVRPAGEREGGQDVDELGGQPGPGSARRARVGAGSRRRRGAGRAGGAAARPARARRQAVTPLPVSTPRPSGNASARACRAA